MAKTIDKYQEMVNNEFWNDNTIENNLIYKSLSNCTSEILAHLVIAPVDLGEAVLLIYAHSLCSAVAFKNNYQSIFPEFDKLIKEITAKLFGE